VIDKAIPSDAARRRAAGRAILAAEPVDFGSLDGLKRELAEIRGGAVRTRCRSRAPASISSARWSR
jgi:hypothetical protein